MLRFWLIPGGKVITRNSLTEKLGVGETEAELIRLCILERRVEVDRLLDAFGEPQWSDDEVSTRDEQVVGLNAPRKKTIPD